MGLNGISSNAAAGLYQNTQGIGGSSSSSVANNRDAIQENDSADSVSFADLLQSSVQDSIETMRTGEDMSAKAVTGEADLTDVVQSITAAELTLQTVVSVRDRMVSAYQEILRMPI